MSSSDSPTPSSSRSLSLVWLVPLLAVALSGWLLFREFGGKGPVIEIEFANGAGIVANKTPLVHKGVVMGLVDEVYLKPALDGVVVRVQLDASAKRLASSGSEFWFVHPEIGLSGVKGLETLFSGGFLSVRAGEGPETTRFKGLTRPPANENQAPGRTFVLKSEVLGSLHAGAALYFREVKVGVVEDHRISDDSTHVLITCRIFEPYHTLVRHETRFWNSGGISMRVGLLGAQVRSNSLESLVSGGVSFNTPDHAANAPEAPEGTVFELAPEAEKAWLKWAAKIPLASPAP